MAKERSFSTVLGLAVGAIALYGLLSSKQLKDWEKALIAAALFTFMQPKEMNVVLYKRLDGIYKDMVTDKKLLKKYPNMDRGAFDRAKDKILHRLALRKFLGADLIEKNYRESIDTVVRRFIGWASSVPAGGIKELDREVEKRKIQKAILSVDAEGKFIVRDQMHKFQTEIEEILSVDGQAIAAKWHSQWRVPGYNYREKHKHIDVSGEVFVIRDNWALQGRLMKLSGRKYTDSIIRPGMEPNCKCVYEYIYSLSDLPDDMLTAKGRAAIAAKLK